MKFQQSKQKIKQDIMRKGNQDTTEVHECAFEANIVHTNAAVKFQCKMFLAWKNMTNKTFCKTTNDNVTLQDGIATFDERLAFQTYLLYDRNNSRYLRKDTSLCLLLVSARKPDEEKLVGRIVVDLGQIMNEATFREVEAHKLSFCSIPNATLTFSIRCLSSKKTDMRRLDLDMDQFSIITQKLNQSASSNNEDVMTFRAITKDLSSRSLEKNKVEGEEKVHHEEDPSGDKSISRVKSQNQQVMVQGPIVEQVHEYKSQLKHEQPEPQPKIIASPQNKQEESARQQINMHKIVQQAQTRQVHHQIHTNQDPSRQTQIVQSEHIITKYDQPASQESEKVHQDVKLEARNSQEAIQLKFQIKKLENQNKTLHQLLETTNAELEGERVQVKRQRKIIHEYEQKLQRVQDQKNLIVQELLQQAQQSSKECIELQNKLKKFESLNTQIQSQSQQNQSLTAQIQKLKLKLQKTQKLYQDSENLRLDIETEMLQNRYQMAQLKEDNSSKEQQIKEKESQIERLHRQLEESRQSKNDEANQSALYRSYSIMSQKEREQYNGQIEALKRKLNRLTSQIQFTSNVKDNLSHLSHACEELSIEKETLLVQLNNLRKQRDQILKEKKDSQTAHMIKERSDSEDMNKKMEFVEEELKAVESELTRYENQRVKLSKNIQELTEQNLFLKDLLTKKTQEQDGLAQKQQQEKQNKDKLNNLLVEKERQIQILTMRLGELQENIKKNDGQNINHEKILKEKDLEIQSINSKNEDNNKWISNLEKDIQKYKDKIDSLGLQLKHAHQQVVSGKKQYEALFQQNKKALSQLSVADKSSQSLKSDFQKIQSQQTASLSKIKTLEKQLSKSQIEASQFNNVVQSLEEQKKRLQDVNKQYSLQLDSVRNQNQYLRMHIQELQAEKVDGNAGNRPISSTPQPQNQGNSYLQRIIEDKNAVLELKQRQIEQMGSNMENQAIKVLELEQRITRFSEKQQKMRQNILILEEESRKIYDIVVQKQQNQQVQAQLIEERDVEIQKLRTLLDDKTILHQIAQEELTEYKRQLFQIEKKQREDAAKGAKQDPQIATSNEIQNKYNELFRLDNQRIQQLQEVIKSVKAQSRAHLDQKTLKINKLDLDLKNQIQSKLVMEHELKVLRNEKEIWKNDMANLQTKIKLLQGDNLELNRLNQELKIKPLQVGSNSSSIQIQYKNIVRQKDEELQHLLETIQHLEQQLLLKKSIPQAAPQTPGTSTLQIERQNYMKRINEHISQIQTLQSQLVGQEQQIKGLKLQLDKANGIIKNMKSQIDDNQVEKMNKELEKQFKLVRDKSKEEIRKSGISNGNDFTLPEIVEACRNLQELLRQRSQKDKAESIIQLMVSKNAFLQEELNKITEERGIIQENARKLSMQFQKIKSRILKGKGSYQQKNQLLMSLKPCEGKVKDLVEITQRIFDSQLENETF